MALKREIKIVANIYLSNMLFEAHLALTKESRDTHLSGAQTA